MARNEVRESATDATEAALGPRLMTEAQTRVYMGGVSRARIAALIERGVLVPIVLGDVNRARRFDRRQIDAAIDALIEEAQA
jgi:hypothetical protein